MAGYAKLLSALAVLAVSVGCGNHVADAGLKEGEKTSSYVYSTVYVAVAEIFTPIAAVAGDCDRSIGMTALTFAPETTCTTGRITFSHLERSPLAESGRIGATNSAAD